MTSGWPSCHPSRAARRSPRRRSVDGDRLSLFILAGSSAIAEDIAHELRLARPDWTPLSVADQLRGIPRAIVVRDTDTALARHDYGRIMAFIDEHRARIVVWDLSLDWMIYGPLATRT